MQPCKKLLLTFVRHSYGSVNVALNKAKRHGAVFGPAHVLLKFPFRDCVKRSFVHAVLVSTRQEPEQWRVCHVVISVLRFATRKPANYTGAPFVPSLTLKGISTAQFLPASPLGSHLLDEGAADEPAESEPEMLFGAPNSCW